MLENATLAKCVLGGVYEEALSQQRKLIEFEGALPTTDHRFNGLS